MSKKYRVLQVKGGSRRIDKQYQQWLDIMKHFREKGIKHLSIRPLDEAIKRDRLLELYKELDMINGALLFGADEWEKEKEIRDEIEALEMELRDEQQKRNN